MDDLQESVLQSRPLIRGVDEVLDRPVVTEQAVAGQHPIAQEQGVHGFRGLVGDSIGLVRVVDRVGGVLSVESRAHRPQRSGQRPQRLDLKGCRPCRDQAGSELGVGRLQRVVPVAMSVGRQRAAGHRAGNDLGQRAPDMLEHRLPRRGSVVVDKRDPFGEQADVAGDREVLPQRQDRPEDNITVRVALPANELAGVELE